MNPQAHELTLDSDEPPRKGLPLGWRVGLSTALIVSVVMGTMTSIEHRYSIDTERRALEDLFQESLAPLLAEIERGRNLSDVRAVILAFHRAYLQNGKPNHELMLSDSNGALVFSTVSEDGQGFGPTLRVDLPIASPLLVGGRGTLSAWEDASAFEATVDRQWQAWRLHMSVTIASILLFLVLAMRFMVTRPLLLLLDGVRKMEMGYWGDLPVPRGAWEIRWLCWRFRNMGLELQRTVQQLVAAERRAIESMDVRVDAVQRAPVVGDDDPQSPGLAAPAKGCEQLREKLQTLESLRPGDPSAAALAREALDGDAADADRMGDRELKARLEDAAFRILEPDEHGDLEKALVVLKQSLDGLVQRRETELKNALASRSVPFTRVEHRIKNTAGIWKKMHSKGLELEQIHDLVAFRIVVPTELGCYSALGVIHRAFEPVVGRFKDYIAAPKPNGYQSLHTCVRSPEGPVFEIQIRSVAMHQQAEQGDAAHWAYKVTQPPIESHPFAGRRSWRYLRNSWKHWRAARGAFRAADHDR